MGPMFPDICVIGTVLCSLKKRFFSFSNHFVGNSFSQIDAGDMMSGSLSPKPSAPPLAFLLKLSKTRLCVCSYLLEMEKRVSGLIVNEPQHHRQSNPI